MNPFQLLIKPVSFRCNLQCTYCFYLRIEEVYSQIKRPQMTLDTLEQLISHYLGFRFIESIFGWQGGEPTLAGLEFFKNVVDLQQKHGSSGQIIGNALQTNGLLINDEWGQFLHNYKFLVGLSLDGPKHIHDRYRKTRGGKSVWENVMNAATILRDHQVEFNILCVVSKANVNNVKEIYTFFIENDFRYLQFIPALETDEKGNRAPFSVSAAQYGKFLSNLFNQWKVAPHGMSIRLFDGLLSYYLGHSKGICALEKSCADYLLIEWNGDVYPCDFFVEPERKLGNIMSESLSNLKHKRDTSFGLLKRKLDKECFDCNWLHLCYGGCIKDRVFSDNPRPNRTYFCEAYKRFYEYSNQWFKEFAESLKRG